MINILCTQDPSLTEILKTLKQLIEEKLRNEFRLSDFMFAVFDKEEGEEDVFQIRVESGHPSFKYQSLTWSEVGFGIEFRGPTQLDAGDLTEVSTAIFEICQQFQSFLGCPADLEGASFETGIIGAP